MIYNSSYKGLDDLGEAVERTVKALSEHLDKFDFIAVRGCSGMLVGAPVSLAIGKPLVVARKPTEDSHSWSGKLINDAHAHGRYIFLDDFISSGATERAVIQAIEEARKNDWQKCEYVGSYEYCSGWEYDTGSYDNGHYKGKLIWHRELAELEPAA